MVRKKISFITKRKAQILRRRSKNGNSQFELLVRKTGRHTYVDLIDLFSGSTLNTISTLSVLSKNPTSTKKEAVILVGKNVALYCKDKQINPSINIANHKFCGLVKELIDSFSGGLQG